MWTNTMRLRSSCVFGDYMKNDFCSVDNYSVLIPYRDLVKIAEMAQKVELIESKYDRLLEQYSAIRGMFCECLDKIKEIQDFVSD